jgi:hypothetical protein
LSILNFNAQTVAPSTAFEPLPAGWYNVKIVESETKPVAAAGKTGSYLALTLEVLDGTYIGRKIFLNLNLENENPVAVKIAYEQLSAICYVTGQIQCERSEQLHGIPFQAKLTVRDAANGYDASNNVKGFRDQYGREPKELAGGGAPASGAAPATPPAPGAPPAPPPPPATATAPPPPVVHDPMAAAIADGWIVHPTSPGYLYKGNDVKPDAEVAAMYPAPAAPPPPPAIPVVPVAPAAPVVPQAPVAPTAPAAGGGAAPPWAKPAA